MTTDKAVAYWLMVLRQQIKHGKDMIIIAGTARQCGKTEAMRQLKEESKKQSQWPNLSSQLTRKSSTKK
jgi:uncharacterized NAD-dependent epimerase/dehydratase family protein